MEEKFDIRIAVRSDAREMLAIYSHYVETTAITFDSLADLPDAKGFADKVEHTLERYPWLVAASKGFIIGYACAGPFRQRAAYDWSAEVTIYIAPDFRGEGVGRALYAELERMLIMQGVRTLFAYIATTPREHDPYLTDASPRFHERMGYTACATMTGCGNKFGKWYDCIWMQKRIGPLDDSPARPLPFPEAMRTFEQDAPVLLPKA